MYKESKRDTGTQVVSFAQEVALHSRIPRTVVSGLSSLAKRQRHLQRPGALLRSALSKMRQGRHTDSAAKSRPRLTTMEIVNVPVGARAESFGSAAKRYKMSNRSVGRCVSTAAYTTLLTEEITRESLLERFRDDPPWGQMTFPMFDGTKTKLSFTFLDRKIRQSVEVLVLRICIAWCWLDGRPMQHMQCTLPPIPVWATGAHPASTTQYKYGERGLPQTAESSDPKK
jgi:hypothetical protein